MIKMLKLGLLVVGLCCVTYFLYSYGCLNPVFRSSPATKNIAKTIDHTIRDAAEKLPGSGNAEDDIKEVSQLTGKGRVIRVLSDDLDGIRHQRFIIKLPTGQTLLVAHNIDLASRLPNLKAGDTVEFSGEFIWTPKGGIIHRTHHSTDTKHADGWLKYKGNTYQ